MRRALLLLLATLAMSACATTQARMHSDAELASVGRQCGLALGELFQDESEKRLLFFFKVAPSAQERLCVANWARKNKLRAVFVEAVNEPQS